jgi:putative cardiolipin synthase
MLSWLLAGCASLPSTEDRPRSTAYVDTAATRLGSALSEQVAAHRGLTGVHAIDNPRDAYATRVLLANVAQKSIDAQYYIWRGDEVGFSLLNALWQAAERGVRVRLLLDDVGTHGLDKVIAALDAHPDIEVRLYNPLVYRGARAINGIVDFSRINRRMHNKSFTFDNQVTVVGGRNIANEYFAAGTGALMFADLDVAAAGAAVAAVSAQFDLYWNSSSAYPVRAIVGASTPAGTTELQAKMTAMRSTPEALAYGEALRDTPIVKQLLDRSLAFDWARVDVLSDDPQKTLDESDRTDILLLPQLLRTIGQAQREFDLVSPYFVPAEAGTAALVAMAQRGVAVRVLTNSLASSEGGTTHSGYAKRRSALLAGGVRLFELRPAASRPSRDTAAGIGSSGASALHAKTFAVDRERIFVGSFNFDPRSARLNTELGFMINSPALAARLSSAFDAAILELAYEVRLQPDGRSLVWIERTAAGEVRHETEPQTSWFARAKVNFLSILPIDWLL